MLLRLVCCLACLFPRYHALMLYCMLYCLYAMVFCIVYCMAYSMMFCMVFAMLYCMQPWYMSCCLLVLA